MSSPLPDGEMIRSLVAEVQRLGLSTASNVAERFAAMARGVGGGDGPGSAGGANLADLPGFAAAIEGWRSVLAGLADVAGATSGRTPAPGHGIESVDLSRVSSGGVAEGRAHLHNTTTGEIAGVRLRPTEMIEAGGGTIPTRAITVTPDVIEHAPAGSSHAVVISVAVAADQAPGTYHGLLTMSEPPGGVIAVRVTVAAPADDS